MIKKLTTILIISLMLVCILQISSFAVIDQAKLFLSNDWSNDTKSIQTMNYAVKTYKNLGYDVQGGNLPGLNYTVTNSKSTVLDYIKGTGNNYAFFEYAHGGPSYFIMKEGDINACIFTYDITGYWHFVFLNSCSSMENDSLAVAFKTTGYSNRASLGWYTTVKNYGSEEWWSKFKDLAGKTDLRTACLKAADGCQYSTPIRIYGDKTWNGKAWNK